MHMTLLAPCCLRRQVAIALDLVYPNLTVRLHKTTAQQRTISLGPVNGRI